MEHVGRHRTRITNLVNLEIDSEISILLPGVDTGFFDWWGSATRERWACLMFTFIGMINLTMVVNSTNK